MFLTDNVASVVRSYCFSLKGLLGNAILPLNPAGREHFRLERGRREHLLFLMWDLKERKRRGSCIHVASLAHGEESFLLEIFLYHLCLESGPFPYVFLFLWKISYAVVVFYPVS